MVSPDSEGYVNFVALTSTPVTPVKFCAMQIKVVSEDPNCKLVLKA